MSWQRSLPFLAALGAAALVAGCALGDARPSASSALSSAAPGQIADSGDVVYLRNMGRDPAIVAIDADTGKEVARYPSGVTTPAWNAVYGTERSAGNTVVFATDLRRGDRTAVHSVASGSSYELPAVTFAGEPGGLSPNARWLALASGSGYSDASGKSPFLVLDSKLQQPAKVVELSGNYTFDAISDSGQYLYLEEHLGKKGEDGYRVRAYDLNAQRLLEGIVVDKGVGTSSMVGNRVGTIASPDGRWQYTLYWRQGGNPFVHAIKLEEAWSVCLFLPVQTFGEEDFAWSFVSSPDGGVAYAINSLKGYVASIDLLQARVIRTATLDLQATAPGALDELARFFFPTAEAKSEMFSVGVVSPDGRTLFASADYGRKLFAIDTQTLTVKARYRVDMAGAPLQLIALGISPDGARLYGLDSNGGSLVRIDAASGRVLGSIATQAQYFGRILRVTTR